MTAPPDDWASPAKAAASLGITRQQLCRKLEELQAVGAAQRDGKRWYVRLEDLALTYAQVAPGSALALSPPTEEGAPAGDAEEGKIPPQHVSKARREHYLAEMAEMESRRRAGELIEVSFVSQQVFSLTREFRDRLITRPAQWAPELLGLENVVEIEIRLEEFVREFLLDLTSEDRGLPARVDQALERGPEP
jgi:hypothetical protein